MSNLTRCNYCTLEDMRRRNRYWSLDTEKRPDGWLDVWVKDSEDSEPRVVASFMALTDHCVCND